MKFKLMPTPAEEASCSRYISDCNSNDYYAGAALGAALVNAILSSHADSAAEPQLLELFAGVLEGTTMQGLGIDFPCLHHNISQASPMHWVTCYCLVRLAFSIMLSSKCPTP